MPAPLPQLGHVPPLRVLTPQDGALLGWLQNQTFWLAGLASRRKLFLLYSRKRHWKTLTRYQHRCRTRGHSPWLCQPGAAPSGHLCHAQLLGMGFPRVVNAQMPSSKARSFTLALPTPGPELTLETLCWFITVGNRAHIPPPGLIPHPFPPAVNKSFQICRLNTFFVHFRPFTLYPTSLGSNNIFPSFDHSVT